MIRESLYFSFDGIKSTDYPIVNIEDTSGLYQESLASGKTINETYPRGAFKPYFFGVQREVKQFDLSFAFLEPWNEKMIFEIINWLNVDNYKPLFFEADVDTVFYAMPISSIEKMHNGLQEGYLTLTVRCDSSYAYGHKTTTPWLDSTDEISIRNLGHYPLFPEMWIRKVGDGDIFIRNISNGAQEMRFKNIDIGEELYIDCTEEIIETNKENTHRYDDFNDEYLKIIYGRNFIEISSNIEIKFRYQYVFS